MSMIKKGVSARGGIALSSSSNEIVKCSNCGKYISGRGNSEKCPHCGSILKK